MQFLVQDWQIRQGMRQLLRECFEKQCIHTLNHFLGNQVRLHFLPEHW